MVQICVDQVTVFSSNMCGFEFGLENSNNKECPRRLSLGNVVFDWAEVDRNVYNFLQLAFMDANNKTLPLQKIKEIIAETTAILYRNTRVIFNNHECLELAIECWNVDSLVPAQQHGTEIVKNIYNIFGYKFNEQGEFILSYR